MLFGRCTSPCPITKRKRHLWPLEVLTSPTPFKERDVGNPDHRAQIHALMLKVAISACGTRQTIVFTLFCFCASCNVTMVIAINTSYVGSRPSRRC
jgi:hypothetical protein